MNHRITTFILSSALLLSASPALAQSIRTNFSGTASGTPLKTRAELEARIELRKASTTERVMQLKANVETRKAEMKVQIEARKASSTAKRVEMQQSIAKRKAEHTAKVLSATVERLENILSRLDSRINKINLEGGNTADAEAFVAEARNHLSEAKANIALFVSLDLTGDKLKENFERIRTLAGEIKEDMRGAHESLKEALKALKDERKELKRSATSTPESE